MTLREEILKRDFSRYYILAFTIAAIGVALNEALPHTDNTDQMLTYRSSALAFFALALIGAAIALNQCITQRIDLIASYIRVAIEPSTEGLRWESTLYKVRYIQNHNAPYPVKAIGASRYFSLYYAVLTIMVFIVGISIGLHRQIVIMTLFTVSAIVCLLLSYYHGMRNTESRHRELDKLIKGYAVDDNIND